MTAGSTSPDSSIPIREGVAIAAHEIWFEFTRSDGPGGQKVNKTSSRAVLCFALEASPSLLSWQKRRVHEALANRISADGVLRVPASDQRSQSQNREAALARFQALLAEALRPRPRRIPTVPSRAARARRIRAKKHRSERKHDRGAIDLEE